MHDEPGYVVYGACWSCGALFTFNPLLVPSVPIDPDTQLPPDVGNTDPARAVRQPLCELCVARANVKRAARGDDPISVLPGAYDVARGLPE